MPTDDQPPKRWQDLNASKRKAIVEMAEQPGVIDRDGNFIDLRALVSQFGLSRRQGLQAMALIAGGATIGNAIMQSMGVASAAASESDSDGDVGQTSSRVDVFADGVDANSVTTDQATLNGADGHKIGGNPLIGFKQTSALSISFDTWTTIDADRPAWILLQVNAETDGTTNGQIKYLVDQDGGTTADFNYTIALAESTAGSGYLSYETVMLPVPEGAQVQIKNEFDPNNGNSIDTSRKVVL